MEEECKPEVQPQRRLNPSMKEVVKSEVIKLLDASMIYPIFNSPWVSHVQVVPKKGGMTVVITVFRSTWMTTKNEVATDLFCTGVIGHPGHVFLS